MGDYLVEVLMRGSDHEVWTILEDILTRYVYPLEDEKRMEGSGRREIESKVLSKCKEMI